MRHFDQISTHQGLYDPRNEHDSCGIGFVVDIKTARATNRSARVWKFSPTLSHRGAVGADPLSGDGAGILLNPRWFPARRMRLAGLQLPAPGDYAVGMVFFPRIPTPCAQSEAALRARLPPKISNCWAGGTYR